MHIRTIFLVIFASFFSDLYSQPQRVRFPLNDILLAGHFGEPRQNHFHSGVDFKTFKEGLAVYAINDGFVSRIVVATYGYGLALYINHPDGFTSVYAHLSKFNTEIQNFIIKEMYDKKLNFIDTIFNDDKFTVKTGQIIGYSGNTGQSDGPHLHFEIRKTKTQNPLNPAGKFFNFLDNIPPELQNLYVFPICDNFVVPEYNNVKKYKIHKISENNYSLNGIITITGLFALGIEYLDRMDRSTNRFGAKRVRVFQDEKIIYDYVMEELVFEKQKNKNSVFDYYQLLYNKRHVHKLYVEPNNDLNVFEKVLNHGLIYIEPNRESKFKIVVIDFNGNESVLNFTIRGDFSHDYSKCNQMENVIKWNENYLFVFDDARIEIDSGTFFYDVPLRIEKKIKSGKSHYKIGEDYIFPKKSVCLCLYSADLNPQILNKAFIARNHNNKISYIKSEIHQSYICANSSLLGEFFVSFDTVPPLIRPKNFSAKTNLSNFSFFEFEISDNLSGIKNYNIYINDKWVLAEYEPKQNRLRYYFDENLPKSQKFTIKVVVEDSVGNVSEYKSEEMSF
jgi:hypothetical protein